MTEQQKDYSLWLFLDLENYGDPTTAKVLDKAVRKTSEFRGTRGKRLYFEFADKFDKANFIYTVTSELKRQGYRSLFVTERDNGVPQPIPVRTKLRDRVKKHYIQVPMKRV